MKKIWGYIAYGFAHTIEFIYSLIIVILEFIVKGANTIKNLMLPIIILLIFGAFAFWPFLILLITPLGISFVTFIIILFIIAYLGKALLNNFYRINYAHVKFFFDYAKYFKDGSSKYRDINYYKNEYDQMKQREFEEELRREEERRRQRRKQQEEQWKKFFEDNFRGYSQGNYQGSYQGNNNPFSSFKKRYEQACDILGVSYDADYDTIKSAYRRLAKKYHPDISKEKNADEMFKKINNAFDFLSEENVNRYKNI